MNRHWAKKAYQKQDLHDVSSLQEGGVSVPQPNGQKHAEIMRPSASIEPGPLLNEIDYGLAEGMSLAELNENFPNILHDWTSKKDPRFPEGENQADVQARLNLFLRENFLNANSAIVTHNVVLRSLIGKTYNTESRSEKAKRTGK